MVSPARVSERRLSIPNNPITGILLAIPAYFVGIWFGTLFGLNDERNTGVILGYLLATVAFLAGVGFLNYPLERLFGWRVQPISDPAENRGVGRFFRLSLDHKVIGIQYLVTILVMLLFGGIGAMLIRTSLLVPDASITPAGNYLPLIGLHSVMMIFITSAVIVGPFGNYLVPLMIGARRMAFPRLEALSFWVVPPAAVILAAATFWGGFPTGWTGYPPLSEQALQGMDSYIVGFTLIAIALVSSGVNMLATIIGLFGVALLSWFVWQHHLFVSGIAPVLRPFYMLSTELISIPTGIIFLVTLGTLWRARVWFTVPMLFCMGFLFNFLIGGISGVYLSDVPTDVTLHGSYFSMAHFHYTIMGGEIFALMAACYYWLPKMTGKMLSPTIGRIHFWTMFIAFNSTFFPLFIIGLLNMPRRVSTYDPALVGLNRWVTVSAYVLFGSMVLFAGNLIYSWFFVSRTAAANPWHARSLEWQGSTPVPPPQFDPAAL